MAFAELLGAELRLRILRQGEIVTTSPKVIHNVYLAEGAVIHTVKHGLGEGEDRLTDERTKAFDIVTHDLKAEPAIHAAAIKPAGGEQYSHEYRHFDMLIWQVPAWSTAIFALTIQVLFDVLDSTRKLDVAVAGALALFGSFALACFAFVMLRFRCHQRKLKAYSPTPKWMSASTITQSLVTLEASSAFVATSLATVGGSM